MRQLKCDLPQQNIRRRRPAARGRSPKRAFNANISQRCSNEDGASKSRQAGKQAEQADVEFNHKRDSATEEG
ncbi:uncharacterized protein BO96DRAFT_337866 [Aspergillus niger CBS 101883]|uniref:Contig An18c0190, genomic contig n=2 Tax=Aspergillus niger TaxID=5061 RepID=A2RBA9_ASPNC|nr:uncharacterized protein BO96DRAFT_337866 [Aspergillus niger CBS 101883]XP_059602984.1 uncharacterized protein An18g06090 [Aspergillus niger]PYH56488.1 hypothetical protein BO96DRAFT_337866 [Aspergillus niger CBS 101883]CAK43333.1 unnamed protein product [Aspergillus niger]